MFVFSCSYLFIFLTQDKPQTNNRKLLKAALHLNTDQTQIFLWSHTQKAGLLIKAPSDPFVTASLFDLMFIGSVSVSAHAAVLIRTSLQSPFCVWTRNILVKWSLNERMKKTGVKQNVNVFHRTTLNLSQTQLSVFTHINTSHLSSLWSLCNIHFISLYISLFK